MARAKKRRSKAMNKRKREGKKSMVTLAPDVVNGDHGTGTTAAKEGTVLVKIKNDPNRRAYLQRVDAYLRINLDMRQQQAAKAIRDAYCKVQMLSSGGPLKERVQASPKPDQTIDIQVAAQSRLMFVMAAVPQRQRRLIEHVLWENKPIRSLGIKRGPARFRWVMDLVADHVGY